MIIFAPNLVIFDQYCPLIFGATAVAYQIIRTFEETLSHRLTDMEEIGSEFNSQSEGGVELHTMIVADNFRPYYAPLGSKNMIY